MGNTELETFIRDSQALDKAQRTAEEAQGRARQSEEALKLVVISRVQEALMLSLNVGADADVLQEINNSKVTLLPGVDLEDSSNEVAVVDFSLINPNLLKHWEVNSDASKLAIEFTDQTKNQAQQLGVKVSIKVGDLLSEEQVLSPQKFKVDEYLQSIKDQTKGENEKNRLEKEMKASFTRSAKEALGADWVNRDEGLPQSDITAKEGTVVGSYTFRISAFEEPKIQLADPWSVTVSVAESFPGDENIATKYRIQITADLKDLS